MFSKLHRAGLLINCHNYSAVTVNVANVGVK